MADKYIPTESAEQIALFQWAQAAAGAFPALRLMFAIPNGGNRNIVTATRLKAEGVKSGVPDIFLAAPSGEYHGLFLELKRLKGGEVSEAQEAWLKGLSEKGYGACIAKGWKEAADIIVEYLTTGDITFAPTRGRGGEYHAGGKSK